MKKIKVFRTSGYFFSQNIKPCDGVVEQEIKDDASEQWVFEYETSEQLIAFMDSIPEPLIYDGDSLEIYDDRRE